MRQSAIIGYPKGGGEAECLDCGDGPRLDQAFREIRSGQRAVEGYERVELWTRLKGRVKRYTPKDIPQPASKEVPSDAPGESEDEEKSRLRALLKENDVKFGPRTSLEKLRELAGELN